MWQRSVSIWAISTLSWLSLVMIIIVKVVIFTMMLEVIMILSDYYLIPKCHVIMMHSAWKCSLYLSDRHTVLRIILSLS